MTDLQIFTDEQGQGAEVIPDAEKETESNSIESGADASEKDFSDTETVQNTPIATPEPTQEQDGLSEQDKKDIAEQVQDVLQNQEETEPETEFGTEQEYTIDDIYTLLSDYCEKQDAYQKEVLENQKFYTEQSKNLLAVSSAILLALGILSGILLARIVWRKL